MLEQIDNLPEDIFGIKMSGKIKEEQFREMDEIMTSFKEQYGKMKFLAVMEDFEYSSPSALWEDLRTGLKYYSFIEKAALVSDTKWIKYGLIGLEPLIPNIMLKAFGANERDEAITWLKQSKSTTGQASNMLTFIKKSITKSKTMKSQTVVITGASAGVGRAIAKEFAKDGAKILLIARGKDGLHGAKQEVEDAGGQAWIYEADVSDAQQMEEAADYAEENLGPIDVWINNAMVSVFSKVIDMKPDEYKRVTDVTYLGQVYGTLAALKKMKKRNYGKIILVGSALAFRGIPLQSAYCASKHAIQGFFESLRSELMHDEINVDLSIVHLPAMNTTQFGWVKSRFDKKPKPMGTIFQPEVAARAIKEVAETGERLRMVGFSTVKTIWGNKLVPEYLDEYMAEKGISGQLTQEDEDPDRENNLWDPVPGDHGTHGNFDKTARSISVLEKVYQNKRGVALVGGIFLGSILTRMLSSK